MPRARAVSASFSPRLRAASGQRRASFGCRAGQFAAAFESGFGVRCASFGCGAGQFAAAFGADLQTCTIFSPSSRIVKQPVVRPGSAEDTLSESRSAARRPRQPSEGLPAVSADAINSPPSRLRSVRNCWRFWALACGSASFQNMCAPRLAGNTVSARAAEARRGSLPVASSRPPPI